MNKLKKEKGITLVALIITIVVLLILAVVSIGAVSDSNIIEYAQNAVKDYNKAKEEQEVLVKEYETEIEKYIPNNNVVEIGVKAYQFGSQVVLITPDNKLVNFEDKLLPTDIAQLTSNTGDYTVKYEGFDEEEVSKMQVLYVRGMPTIVAYVGNNRDIAYYGLIATASATKEVTISKSTAIQHDPSLLAQYYHEDVYYYFPEYTYISGPNINTECEFIISLANCKLYNIESNSVNSMMVFVNKGTVLAEEKIVVDVENDGTVTIREGAQKFEYYIEDYTFNAYIQDGNLYYFRRTGIPYNFINTALLPTE